MPFVAGQTIKGLNSLNDVLNDPITPPWLRVEAEKIISKWQPK
jgi:adenylyl- and sulfurtransferase ThiI